MGRERVPCVCFVCRGRLRDPRTVLNHGHRRRQDALLVSEELYVAPAAVVDEDDADAGPIDDTLDRSTWDLLAAYDNFFDEWERESAPGEASADSNSTIQTGELIMLQLDWMCMHKATQTATQHMWSILKLCFPEKDNHRTTTYAKIMAFVKKHRLETMEKVEMCPCGATIYRDSSNALLQKLYPHCGAHRTRCQKCGKSRYTKSKKPWKHYYYFPVRYWLQDLFMRPDLVEYLRTDVDTRTFPSGSIQRSRGYKRKVLDNFDDPRHIGLVGCSDGIPFFKDKQSKSVWPFVLRAVLPPSLWNEPSLCHLTLLMPSEHLVVGEDGQEVPPISTQHNSTQLNSTQLKSTQLYSKQIYSIQLKSNQLNST